MEKELISVLLVNYNHESTIGETIESVLGQTYKNIQFIIVDDGSTDKSYDVIKEYEDERIELFQLEENNHICYATNYGFNKVKGAFLARIDSDDIWYPDKLEKQMKFLHQNPERYICFTWIDLIDENGDSINQECREMLRLFETNFKGQEDCLHTFYYLGNCLSHPSVLMRSEVMREIGDFDLGYMQAHDFDYWIRIAKKYPIYVMPERLLAMRRFIGDGQKTINNSNSSEISNTRFFNEFTDIRAHFFDNMDKSLFCNTFRQDFINKDAETDLELECEKAFLLCTPIYGETSIPPAGISFLHKLLRDHDAVDVLKRRYHFTAKDFYKMTGEHIYCDKIWGQKLFRTMELCDRLIQENAGLEEENKIQKRIIREYSQSTSWKLTAPMRYIGKIIKR